MQRRAPISSRTSELCSIARMRSRSLAVLVVVSSLTACKDPPPPAPATNTGTPSAPSASGSIQQLPDKCEVTIFPGEKVTTDEGEEKIAAGKPLGIGVENGKTYCIGDKQLTPATTLADARPMFPAECTVEDR